MKGAHGGEHAEHAEIVYGVEHGDQEARAELAHQVRLCGPRVPSKECVVAAHRHGEDEQATADAQIGLLMFDKRRDKELPRAAAVPSRQSATTAPKVDRNAVSQPLASARWIHRTKWDRRGWTRRSPWRYPAQTNKCASPPLSVAPPPGKPTVPGGEPPSCLAGRLGADGNGPRRMPNGLSYRAKPRIAQTEMVRRGRRPQGLKT